VKANQLNVFQDAQVQTELENIYRVLNQIGYNVTAGQRCENLDAYTVEITAVASGTDISAAHGLKRTPSNWIQCWSNVSGVTYESSSGVSANSDTAFWTRVTVPGNYRLILI